MKVYFATGTDDKNELPFMLGNGTPSAPDFLVTADRAEVEAIVTKLEKIYPSVSYTIHEKEV